MKKGLVIKSTGSWYQVLEQETGEIFEARIRGKFKLNKINGLILQASQHTKNLSKNPNEVSGIFAVKIKHAKSILEAIICASLERFTDLRMR